MVWNQMKISVLIKELVLVFVLLFSVACSDENDPENDNLPPSSFQVIVSEVLTDQVTISWTASEDPEGSTVFYDVFLEDVKLADNITSLDYVFNNLTEGVQYSGEIVASDPEGNTVSVSFNFETSTNQPPTNFDVWVAYSSPFSTRMEWTESTDPEGEVIIYNVYFDGELLAEGINNLYVYLPELKGLTEYSGKIVAVDIGGKTTEQTFSFISEIKIYDDDLQLENQPAVEEFGNAGYNGIEGDLTIGTFGATQNNVSDLSLLESIDFVNGDLRIRNTICQDFSGLQNIELTYYYARIEVDNNDQLLNFNGLSGIQSTHELYIADNHNLLSLDGLESLTTITNYMSIAYNPLLNSISGLQNLNQVTNTLSILNNDSLLSLTGLEQITTAGQVSIGDNLNLLTLQGLHNLVSCSSISLQENASLNTLVGLSGLSSTGSISVAQCPSLTNLNGLQNLTAVNRKLSIFECTGLLTLEGIENVIFTDNSVNLHELVIWGNTNITNLDPLQNYTFNRGYISIISNTSLTDLCGLNTIISEIDDFINDYNFASGNAYNPGIVAFANGDCAL